MASDVTVQLVDATPQDAAAGIAAVQEVFRDVEAACTRFDQASPLMIANSDPRRWHQVPVALWDAVSEAYRAYLDTDGLFDPRVLGSLQALGYGQSLPFGASDIRLAAGTSESLAGQSHPWRPRFRTGGRQLRLGPTPIDLGGIGKGLAVRWAMEALDGCGSAALVEAGGDLACRGSGPEGTGWRAAVENPLDDGPAAERRPIAVLDVTDRAVATSSTRLRHWQIGGRAVHHLIDPRTGRSAASGLAAVTVIHHDAARAEVWSKALFVMGAEQIGAEAERRDLAALWVTQDGLLRASAATRDRLLWRADDDRA